MQPAAKTTSSAQLIIVAVWKNRIWEVISASRSVMATASPAIRSS